MTEGFGELVARQRKERKWTLQKMATEVTLRTGYPMSTANLSKYERGAHKGFPEAATIAAIADTLGLHHAVVLLAIGKTLGLDVDKEK